MRDELIKKAAQAIKDVWLADDDQALDWTAMARAAIDELAKATDDDLTLSNVASTLVAQRARIAELEAATKKHGAFDGGLVERLVAAAVNRVPAPEGHTMMEFTPEHRIKSTRADVLAILSELAAMPVDMLLADKLFNECDLATSLQAVSVENYLRTNLGPILAAKDAEIDECRRLLSTRVEAQRLSEANARIAELEKRLAEQTAAAQKDASNPSPVDATGKTPGQVSLEGRTFARIDAHGLPVNKAVQWSMLENDEQLFEEIGAQAVLRAFGGAEALRRVRERAQAIETHFRDGAGNRQPHTAKGAIKDFVVIIDEELAKINEPHR